MEPEEIDVIARNLALDDQRRLGIFWAVSNVLLSSFSSDLRQLADRQQDRIRYPVVRLHSDRIDADGDAGSTVNLSFQLDASPLAAGESILKRNGAMMRGFPARLAPLIVSSADCPRRNPTGWCR